MSDVSAVFEAVRKQLPEIEYRLDEPLKNHTSFKIGGNVKAMFFPRTQEDVIKLCRVLYECGDRPFVLGNGTNILAEDGRLDMIVLKTHGCLTAARQTGDTEMTAESGILLSKLAVFALEHSLTGLEFAHGIPGTLGGAVSMNAGAYGGEMKDIVVKTTAVAPDSQVFDVIGDAHGFSYRRSRFSEMNHVILSSVLKLDKGDPEVIKSRMDELSRKRRESQPLNLPSAGSTFKRPQGGYAAALIEQAGLKGYVFGGAMVSEKHAGFVVNRGNATFSDVMAVIDHVRETVLKQFSIELEPEVKIIKSRQV
jgi:UDP-N-acetylmuramate dehydrogenase